MRTYLLSFIFLRWKKKLHLKRKADWTLKKIWDWEFFREKLYETREGFRVEYDKINEMLDATKRRLEEEKKKEDPDPTIVRNLENLIKSHEPDIAQLKVQMEAIDKQVEEEGGVNNTIKGYRGTLELLKEYERKI